MWLWSRVLPFREVLDKLGTLNAVVAGLGVMGTRRASRPVTRSRQPIVRATGTGQGLDMTAHVASLGGAMNLVILCGLQASGKSTYRERTFDGTHAVVSKDLMSRGSKRSKSMRQELQIREWFESGNSVVVDNTNPAFEDRAALIALGREYSARVVCYHFKSTWDQSLDRNALRTGRARVPYVAIAATSKRWVTPTLSEGFDELYEVVWGPGRTFLEARVG